MLDITAQGNISSTLVGGTLPAIAFVSVGSDVTGWATSTTLPTYYTIYNGDAYPHTVRVPESVHRFNLWIASPLGTRWFDLSQWSATGAGCAVVPDGTGGLVITR